MKAFEHLPRHTDEPEVVFEVFDSVSAEHSYARPPKSHPGQKWLHLQLTNDSQAATYDANSRLLSWFDRTKNLGIYYADNLDRLPYWEYGFPLRSLIHWWSERESFQLVHGAAVTVPGTELGILMPGVGGSGKSTTSLIALDSGFGFLGDDYVIVEPGPPPKIHSAYSSAKFTDYTLERAPWLRELVAVWGSGQDKHVAFLSRLLKNSPCSVPLSAIVLPCVTDEPDSALTPAGRSDCLQAIAPTTVTHLPLGTKTILRKIHATCEHANAYHLTLGRDAAGTCAALRTVTHSLGD